MMFSIVQNPPQLTLGEFKSQENFVAAHAASSACLGQVGQGNFKNVPCPDPLNTNSQIPDRFQWLNNQLH
jgi:hypothetical protein